MLGTISRCLDLKMESYSVCYVTFNILLNLGNISYTILTTFIELTILNCQLGIWFIQHWQLHNFILTRVI